MEKILELLEEYGAVSKDMSAGHGDQRNWRILLAEAIYKQNAAEQKRVPDGSQPLFCPNHHVSYNAVDGCPECSRRG